MNRLLETRRVFIATLIVGLLATAARAVTDPDIWWHLRTGQLVLQNHAVFHSDPYSYTRFGHPWTNHEWLSDVLIFSLYRIAGWAGLIVAFAALVSATLMLVFLRCTGRPYIAGIVTAWGAIAGTAVWGVRPQMLSLFLASLLLLAHDRWDRQSGKWWLVVPAMLLWVNLHAGFALGIALLVLFMAGDALDAAFGLVAWAPARAGLRNLALVLLACLAVIPVNPYGVRMYWYPLATLGSASMQKYIAEWFSPNFHQAEYSPLLFFLLAVFAGLAISPRRLRPSQALFLAAGSLAALYSVRHIPIFVLLAAPVLAGLAQGWLEQHRPSFGQVSQRPTPARMLLNAALLVTACALAVFQVRRVIIRQPETEAATFPAAAVSFLKNQPLPGNLLNHYNWGGYLIWKLYPQHRVFIDGRADLYADSLMDEFATSYYVKNHWEQPLDRWQIQTVILPPDAALVQMLQRKQNWMRIYADSQAVMFRRK